LTNTDIGKDTLIDIDKLLMVRTKTYRESAELMILTIRHSGSRHTGHTESTPSAHMQQTMHAQTAL